MVWKHGTPGDLYTPPNPWRRESPRESPADGTGALHFHLSVTEIKESHTHLHPKRQSPREAVWILHQKQKKKTGMFIRRYVLYGYILPSGHPHTHVCLSCSIGCLIANFPTKIILSPDQFFRTRPEGFANK